MAAECTGRIPPTPTIHRKLYRYPSEQNADRDAAHEAAIISRNSQVIITRSHNFERMAIQIDVKSHPGILHVVADKSGMAHLAGLVADFLTYLQPEDLVYELTEQNSLLPGSPSLVFAYDATLDNLEPESAPSSGEGGQAIAPEP